MSSLPTRFPLHFPNPYFGSSLFLSCLGGSSSGSATTAHPQLQRRHLPRPRRLPPAPPPPSASVAHTPALATDDACLRSRGRRGGRLGPFRQSLLPPPSAPRALASNGSYGRISGSRGRGGRSPRGGDSRVRVLGSGLQQPPFGCCQCLG